MIGSAVAAASYAVNGNYGAVAASMIGFIPGGKIVVGLVSKVPKAAGVLSKVVSWRAKARGIGVSGKLFGYAAHGTKSFGNSTLSRITNGWLRAGWAQGASRGSVAWRVGMRNYKPLYAPVMQKLKYFRR